MLTDWIYGLVGGLMIGSAGAMYLLINGRIMGASGILGGLIDRSGWSNGAERVAFVAALIVVPGVIALLSGGSDAHLSGNLWVVAIAGLLVGEDSTGGGIALGPKPRKYDQKTPKKMVKLATRSALSDRANDGKIVVVDSWDFDAPKTKSAKQALDALDVAGSVLVVVAHDDTNAMLSFRNLPNVQVIDAGELNAYDVLCSDWVVFTKASLPSSEATNEEAPVSSKNAATVDDTPAEGAASTESEDS